MKFIFCILLVSSCFICANGQHITTNWYSEFSYDGITIQNSYPKGGPYTGPTDKDFKYSYLVFFSRIINETDTPIELNLNVSGEAIPIPNSPDTYVKLFLPSDTMTMDKVSSFSYGITEIESLDDPTSLQRTINPKEACLFYVVALFYQTNDDVWNQGRGGNRAELVLKGQDLYYNMLPQINALHFGRIKIKQ